MKRIFKDLKVVELAGVLAGPTVGAFFAELGAKVIKVENPLTLGDVTRSWKLPSESKAEKNSAYYCSVNLLKKVIFADLSNPKANSKIQHLIESADVLIVNFKKGDDAKFGMDYKQLSALNPGLIYASITGFTSNTDRVAYDLILQAESGFMSMNGTAKSGPVKMPVALIDILAAHQLKEAILLALLKRYKSGKGAHVSVSLYDSAIASLANQASNYLNEGFVPGLQGSLHPNIAPYGELFITSDGKIITFAIGSDKQFNSLSGILKIASSVDFSSNQLRLKHREKLFGILKKAVRKFTLSDLAFQCQKSFVPYAEIKNVKQVLESEEARKMILQKKIKAKTKKAVRTIAFKLKN
jgi:crotonobetainyl-CoA:carnitine CoA-transferase CaiB-like acyl-CoA transferase